MTQEAPGTSDCACVEAMCLQELHYRNQAFPTRSLDRAIEVAERPSEPFDLQSNGHKYHRGYPAWCAAVPKAREVLLYRLLDGYEMSALADKLTSGWPSCAPRENAARATSMDVVAPVQDSEANHPYTHPWAAAGSVLFQCSEEAVAAEVEIADSHVFDLDGSAGMAVRTEEP